jgi:hypothetical protein
MKTLMPTPPQNFLDLPKPHHHVSRLLVLVIVLAVIAIVAWLVTSLFQQKQTISVTPPPHVTTDADREAIMEQTSGVTVNTSLTDAQRAALANKKSTTPVGKAPMTDAERRMIANSPAAVK